MNFLGNIILTLSNFPQQITFTVLTSLVILLAVKLSISTKEKKISRQKYYRLMQQVIQCLALYKKNSGLAYGKEGVVLNVNLKTTANEKYAILKEVNELAQFSILISTLRNKKIKEDFHALLKECKKEEKANLLIMRNRLKNLHAFLEKYLNRKNN